MDQSDVHQVLSFMLRTVLVAAAPVMLVALVVGLAISFFQALTQVQEMTLTFVPKIIAIVIALGVSLPFIFVTLQALSDRVFDLIMTAGT